MRVKHFAFDKHIAEQEKV